MESGTILERVWRAGEEAIYWQRHALSLRKPRSSRLTLFQCKVGLIISEYSTAICARRRVLSA